MRNVIFAITLALLLATAVNAEEEAETNPGLFGTSVLEGWTRSLGLGLSGSYGKTEENKLIADAKGQYEDDRHRRKFVAQYYLSNPDVGLTDKKAFAEYEENWKPFANAFFLFGIGRYDYDRIDAWDHRIAASAGVGTELVSTETLQIRASVGAGVTHSWDGLKDTIPDGVVRLGADYIVMEDVTFATTHTYYPNFDDTPEYRLLSDAELKADIGAEGGLTASVGVTNEYDSMAVGENDDLTYYVRLGYDF